MNKRFLCVGVIFDNLIYSFLFILTATFTALKPFHFLSLEFLLFLTVFCAFIPTATFLFVCLKSNTKKRLVYVCLMNIPLFLLFTILHIFVYTYLIPSTFIVEMSPAGGIFVLLSTGVYLLLSVIFRLLVLVGRLLTLRGKMDQSD